MNRWTYHRTGFFGFREGDCYNCSEYGQLYKVWTVDAYPVYLDGKWCERCAIRKTDAKNREEEVKAWGEMNT